MTEAREAFAAAQAIGLAGEPLPPDANPTQQSGWTLGNVKRRVLAGEVIGIVTRASKCLKCGSAMYGTRIACQCWPASLDFPKLAADGYRMEWGALVSDASSLVNGSKFMSGADLLAAQAAGKPIVDSLTGKTIVIKEC